MPHKLLLADDSVTIQRVIELTFADEDVQVIAVGNGQDAIDRVQRDRPDIVLADVGMPQKNGYEVAAFIKGNPATATIPVVLLTGAFEPIDEARARSVGCDGVLVKPFEPQIVINRVKDLLAGVQPPGMWGGGPVAQGPVRQAPSASAFDMRGTSAAGSDPLEAYFDHLDAAFAASPTPGGPEGAAVPPAQAKTLREPIPLTRRPVPESPSVVKSTPASPDDPFAGWDPDLMGDPSRPAPVAATTPAPLRAVPPSPSVVMPVAATPAPVPSQTVAPPTPPAAPAPAVQMPTSLVDAFAALLAAEERIGLKPSAAPSPSSGAAPVSAAMNDEMIEAVTARVLERITEEARPTILDAAERLVKDEIDRIKSRKSGN